MSEWEQLNKQWERNRIEREQQDLRQAKIDQQRFDDRMETIQRGHEPMASSQTGGWEGPSTPHSPSGPVAGLPKEKALPRSREEVVDDLTGALLFLATVGLGGWAGYAVFAAGTGLLAALLIFAGIGLVLHWNPVRKLAEMLVRVFLWLVRVLLWAAMVGGALYLVSLFL